MNEYAIKLRNEPPPPDVRYPIAFLLKAPGPWVVSVLPSPFTFDVWGIELSHDDAWFTRLRVEDREMLWEPVPARALRMLRLVTAYPLFTVHRGESMRFGLEGMPGAGAIVVSGPAPKRETAPTG